MLDAKNDPEISRAHQTFPVPSLQDQARMLPFGSVVVLESTELLHAAGRPVRGLFVILRGSVEGTRRDGLGRSRLVHVFAEGEFLGELGGLSGAPAQIDSRAMGIVEALLIPAQRLRALIIAEAELGERLMRALILHRVGHIGSGSNGPALIRDPSSPKLLTLERFLWRNSQPLHVIDIRTDPVCGPLVQKHQVTDGDVLVVCPVSMSNGSGAFWRIGDLFAGDHGKRGHLVRLKPLGAGDFARLISTHEQRVRNQGSMASPGNGFRTHHRDPVSAQQFDHRGQTLVEIGRQHVVRVASEREIAPRGVGRLRTCAAEPAESGGRRVTDGRHRQRLLEQLGSELRVVSRARNGPHIDQLGDPMGPQQVDEFLDRPCGVPDRESSARWRATTWDLVLRTSVLLHGKYRGRFAAGGTCVHGSEFAAKRVGSARSARQHSSKSPGNAATTLF